MDTIGSRLKLKIRQLGINQKELAEKLNISLSTLNGYFRDYREPDIKTIIRLAKELGTSVEYLIAGDESVSSNKKGLPLNEKAQAAYDMLKKAGLDPDSMTEEDYESVLLFIEKNKDLIKSYSVLIAKGENISE